MSIFSQVPVFKPKTNKINLSHQNILTTSFGRITPVLLEECLPGDVFKVNTEMFVRFQPLMAPIFDQCDVRIDYYFHPSRLGFKGIYNFFTDSELAPGVPAVIPYSYLDEICSATMEIIGEYSGEVSSMSKQLIDYMGLPTEGFEVILQDSVTNVPHLKINMLPFIAYYNIWDKYYRDENLEDNSDIRAKLDEFIRVGGYIDAPEVLLELVRIRYRAYKKDYFTSALPWPQKGDDVLIPVSKQDVNIVSDGNNGNVTLDTGLDGKFFFVDDNGVQHRINLETSGQTSMTINDLRTSMRVQQLLENNARGGTREQEFIKAHWGVYAKDARINDPEYIGGASVPIQISEVLSQVASQQPGVDGNNLGQLGGHGITAGMAVSKKYRVTEHGYLIALMSVRPKASYFQGIPRIFSHLQPFDFFFPELSHLGEQPILNKELVVEPTTIENGADMEGTFGYTPRYAEYKFHGNEVHGDFRDTLKYWHTARIFEFVPGLNKDFISINPNDQGQNRIFNYVNGDYDQILVQLYHHNAMLRKMPYFGIPKF